MYTPIIIFIVSFLGIIMMIWMKSVEQKKNKKLILARIALKTDHKVHAVYDKVKTVASYANRRSFVALIQWIAYHILSWARSFYIKLHRKAHAHPPSKKVIDMVRGRGQVEKGGGASFYLKRIMEEGGEIVK